MFHTTWFLRTHRVKRKMSARASVTFAVQLTLRESEQKEERWKKMLWMRGESKTLIGLELVLFISFAGYHDF